MSHLHKLVTLARALFAAVVLAASARFAWVAGDVTHVLEERALETTREEREPKAEADTRTDRDHDEDGDHEEDARDAKKKPLASDRAQQAKMIRIMLSARHSAGRSPVYVNEALIGHTSFMADFSCQRGEPLVVRIVPEQGPAIERKATCTGPTLSVSD